MPVPESGFRFTPREFLILASKHYVDRHLWASLQGPSDVRTSGTRLVERNLRPVAFVQACVSRELFALVSPSGSCSGVGVTCLRALFLLSRGFSIVRLWVGRRSVLPTLRPVPLQRLCCSVVARYT